MAQQGTATLTADFFGPHDSHNENPPQGQKYLETRIRQTHYRATNRPRIVAFVVTRERILKTADNFELGPTISQIRQEFTFLVPLPFYFTRGIIASLKRTIIVLYVCASVSDRDCIVCKGYHRNNVRSIQLQTDFESNCPLVTMTDHRKGCV